MGEIKLYRRRGSKAKSQYDFVASLDKGSYILDTSSVLKKIEKFLADNEIRHYDSKYGQEWDGFDGVKIPEGRYIATYDNDGLAACTFDIKSTEVVEVVRRDVEGSFA